MKTNITGILLSMKLYIIRSCSFNIGLEVSSIPIYFYQKHLTVNAVKILKLYVKIVVFWVMTLCSRIGLYASGGIGCFQNVTMLLQIVITQKIRIFIYTAVKTLKGHLIVYHHCLPF
jgi:hypothetical protein